MLPSDWPFVNEELGKKQNKRLIAEIHERLGVSACMDFLDKLKHLGFEEATTAGLTIGIEDVLIPGEKQTAVTSAQEAIGKVTKRLHRGPDRQQRALQPRDRSVDRGVRRGRRRDVR